MNRNKTHSPGERIKLIRTNNGLTQQQFADKINKITSSDKLSKGTVNNWEHNRNLPNKERMKAIADVFNTTVVYIEKGIDDDYIDEFLESRPYLVKGININNILSSNNSNINYDDLCKKLEDRQRELSMSDEALSKKLNTSVEKLNSYKKNHFKNLDIDFIDNIIDALNISPDFVKNINNHEFRTKKQFEETKEMTEFIEENINNISFNDIKYIYNLIKEKINNNI